MIDRVIQRPFLLWQADTVAGAGRSEPWSPLPEGVAEVSGDEIVAAQEAVAAAVARELERPLTPPPVEESEERRGEEAAPIEKRSYFPRDPTLSLVQSAVELYLEEHAPDLLSPAEPQSEAIRGDEDSAGADLVLDIDDEDIPAEDTDAFRLAGPFEVTDPGWISSVVAMGWRKFKKRHPFREAAAPPHPLAEDARVIVMGDWGSGIDRAKRVAAEIRKVLDETPPGRECHVVHLGDTYYAGWDYEYRRRFLPHWPVATGEPHGSWSLNGNHDMYTGGHGYFEVLLAEERFKPLQQGSSWFSLENEHWQLLGLDTSWADHDLTGGQAGWVEGKLRDNPGRKTMLLSHHQPFSAYGGGGPKLLAKLRGPLDAGRIDAWLWGHEHRCVVYEPTEHVDLGRCIGHGGIPVYADHFQPAGVRWRLDRSFHAGFEEWALCGFAVLDFDGPSVSERYVNEFGGTDYPEEA